MRFLRFLVVGGTTAGVQFGLLWLCTRVFGFGTAYTLSFLGATAVHYLLNRAWALPSARTDTGRQLGEYLLTVALSYAVNLGALRLFQAWLGLGVMWAAFWALPLGTLVVFAVLNYRVFRVRA